jgi:phosphomevalonate kinase
VHRLAHRAHGAAQRLRGARGSGADVAAAVHGGLLAVRASQKAGRPDLEEPLELRRLGLPAGLHLVPVWTGTPAATPDLICAIETLRTGAPDRHARCIDAIATAARSLVEALAHGDAAAALAAIDRAGAATAALGQAAAVPLTGPVHDHLLALARAAGGTAKPTGAGAGDLALAAFLDPGDAARFRTALAREGFPLLELALDPRGVQIQTPDRTAAS